MTVTPTMPIIITRTPARAGERTCEAACASCVMPLARPSCSRGTSRVTVADQVGHWMALALDMTATTTQAQPSESDSVHASAPTAAAARRPTASHATRSRLRL